MEERFEDLLVRLDRDCGDRIALVEKPGAEGITYHALYGMVQEKRDQLAGERTVVLHTAPSVDWIVTMFAAVTGDHMTVLVDPAGDSSTDGEWTETEEYHPGCLLFFTSGTTGRGKAVVLSQRALLRSAWNGQQMLPAYPEDRLLSCLPLTHVFGFVCSLLWPLTVGALVDIGTGMRGLLSDPKAYDPTIISVVPSLLGFLIRSDALNPALRVILVGAGPCPRELIDAVQAKGIGLYFGYGLTETSSGVAISRENGDPYAMALCPDTQIRITDAGELLLRTPCMMDGYYNDPELTARKLQNGEFHTGDLAVLDPDGNLHITGRMNDVLVMQNGEKIFCPEVEMFLSGLIERDLCLAMQDNALTLIVAAPEAEVKQKVSDAVGRYNRSASLGKQIRAVRFRTEPLPRTVTGKIQRWKL